MKNKKSVLSMQVIHADFKKALAGLTAKNWDEVLSSFLGRLKGFSGRQTEERMVAGWVAALCERAYYAVAHGRSADLRADFEKSLISIVSSRALPTFLTKPGGVICGKQQPSFIKAVVPTLERFQVMECLSRVIGCAVDAIIVGGSMSYIPFFGIRENQGTNDFSDIDILVVINKRFFNVKSWRDFLKENIFPLSEKQVFLRRIKVFKKMLKHGEADIFSHRFSVKGVSFTVSSHFVTSRTFRRMVDIDLKRALRLRRDAQYIMRDFRPCFFAHPCHARHTFNGERIESVIEGRKIKEGAFISDMPGFIISNGRFFPGVYQTVISPAFLVFYDRTGKTSKLVADFRQTLYRETDRMREIYPFATFAKAHNRFDIFPPGRYDQGYDSYVSAKTSEQYLPPPVFSVVKIESNTLPGEVVSHCAENHIRNTRLRVHAKRRLEERKKEILTNAAAKIEAFVSGENHKAVTAFIEEGRSKWHIVAEVERTHWIIEDLPYSYHNGSSNLVIRQEMFTQIITPSDVMRLKAYEELSQKFGKVYVASVMDPVNKDKHTPIGYGVVIQIQRDN